MGKMFSMKFFTAMALVAVALASFPDAHGSTKGHENVLTKLRQLQGTPPSGAAPLRRRLVRKRRKGRNGHGTPDRFDTTEEYQKKARHDAKYAVRRPVELTGPQAWKRKRARKRNA